MCKLQDYKKREKENFSRTLVQIKVASFQETFNFVVFFSKMCKFQDCKKREKDFFSRTQDPILINRKSCGRFLETPIRTCGY